MRLRTSFALGFAAVATAVALVVGAAAFAATAARLGDETDRSLSDGAQELHGRIADHGVAGVLGDRDGRGDRDDDEDRALGERSVLPAQLLAADGSVTALPLSTVMIPVSPQDVAVAAGDDPVRRWSDVRIGGREYRMLTWAAGSGKGAVQIVRDTSDNRRVLAALSGQILAIGLGTALIAAALGLLVARRLTRRLERLGEATQEVARTGSFDVEVPTVGSDEVAHLGDTFNDMLRRLTELRDRQERLLADAGHELRTPLTSLRTNISLLERFGDLPPAAQQRVVADLRGESRELSTLVEEVLTLARGTTDGAPHEPLLVADVARAVVERARRRTGRTVTLTLPDDETATVVLADRAALQRAVWNLLDNAVKFDPSGSPVDVTVTTAPGTDGTSGADDGTGADGPDGTVTVTVADRGPGVPEGERESVFDRFHRGEAARSVSGSGLGLSIVADVARSHGGRVRLDGRDGGGTVAVLTLPTGDRQD